MARQTKRRTKHRGNAAGMIERHGGAGPRASTGSGRGGKRQPVDPRMRPPTWRSAFIRALVAAGIFVVVMLVLGGSPLSIVVTGVVLVGMYTPFGFYADRFFYRRRIAKLGGQPTSRR